LEIKAIEQELSKSQLSSSNLEIAVKKGITISKKASQLWVSSDYSDKQRLQYLSPMEFCILRKITPF
jgi:hypothetical protein